MVVARLAPRQPAQPEHGRVGVAFEQVRPAEVEHEVGRAGLLVDRLLAAVPAAVLTDAARDALEAGRRYAADVGRLKQDAPWARRLIAAGRADDVDACLRLDTTKLVPQYVPNVDKIVGDHR